MSLRLVAHFRHEFFHALNFDKAANKVESKVTQGIHQTALWCILSVDAILLNFRRTIGDEEVRTLELTFVIAGAFLGYLTAALGWTVGLSRGAVASIGLGAMGAALVAFVSVTQSGALPSLTGFAAAGGVLGGLVTWWSFGLTWGAGLGFGWDSPMSIDTHTGSSTRRSRKTIAASGESNWEDSSKRGTEAFAADDGSNNGKLSRERGLESTQSTSESLIPKTQAESEGEVPVGAFSTSSESLDSPLEDLDEKNSLHTDTPVPLSNRKVDKLDPPVLARVSASFEEPTEDISDWVAPTQCPRCGAACKADSRYCAACSAPVMPWKCHECGKKNETTADFCVRCQAPVLLANPADVEMVDD